MEYKKIGSIYKRKYGKTLKSLSQELGVTELTITKWDTQGFDIYFKADQLNSLRGNQRLQKTWKNMKSRCGNQNDKKYKYYGGKGIKIKMSKSDLSYLWERDKACKMVQPSIDRINSDGHYEISNCAFIEMEVNRKKRIYKNKVGAVCGEKVKQAICKECGDKFKTSNPQKKYCKFDCYHNAKMSRYWEKKSKGIHGKN